MCASRKRAKDATDSSGTECGAASGGAADELKDSGKISSRLPLPYIKPEERRGLRTKRRCGARCIRGFLRQREVLGHHRGGKARLIIAVCRRGRNRPRRRAI